jgi:hypothetical protein
MDWRRFWWGNLKEIGIDGRTFRKLDVAHEQD